MSGPEGAHGARAAESGQRVTGSDDVRALLAPASIALVGVSHKGGASRGLLTNLLDHGYPGRLHLVNPRGGEIEGIECHPSVGALPEAPDVALVVAPAEHVPGVVRECGERGVRTRTRLRDCG